MGLFDTLSGRKAKDRFAAQLMAAIEARGWAGRLDYDPEAFHIGLGAAGLRLGEAFADFRRAVGPGHARILGELADLAVRVGEGPPSLAEAVPRLMPVLSRLIHIGDVWAGAAAWERAPRRRAYRPLGGALAASVAVDFGAGVRPVADADLDRWDAGLHEVLAWALTNLRARGAAQAMRRTPGGYFASHWSDGCDAARLLLPELLETLPLKGDPVAVALARDSLLVAGSEEPAALTALARRVEARLKRGDAGLLSAAPLVFVGGAWRPYEGRDLADPLARLAQRARLADWAAQKALLEAHKPAGLEAAHVCDAVGETVGGRLVTRAVLAPDASNFVPLVDLLELGGGDRPRILRTLPQVAAAASRPFYRVDRCEPPRLVIVQPLEEEAWGKLAAREP